MIPKDRSPRRIFDGRERRGCFAVAGADFGENARTLPSVAIPNQLGLRGDREEQRSDDDR
jgi:hypothetical protein